MAKKKKVELPQIQVEEQKPTNLTYNITVPEEAETRNEVVVDLQSGVVKVFSTSESLDYCIKKADGILKKISGPDLTRYVT